MKVKRIDNQIIILILLAWINVCIGQTPVLTISPDCEANATCPNVNITYTISNYNAPCHSIAVINGTVIPDASDDDGTLTVNWIDNGAKGSIVVTKNPSGCGNIAGTRTFNAPIKTLAQVQPTITGPTGPAAGFVLPLTYTAQLNWPFRGTNDPDPFPVNSFTWNLPTGWTNNTSPPTSATISVSTNIGGGGTVTATGLTNCGSAAVNSLPRNRDIVRTLSVPCPIIAQKTTERCGEPTANGFAASSQPSGYATSTPQWSWSLPQGWTFNGPANSQFINVNTDGQHGGNVVATFSDYGVSASCPINIPLIVTTPGTFVNGNDRLCLTQTYSLSSPLPAGASATWTVTPSNAPVTPLSGSGVSATLTPTNSNNGNAGSNATITFSVNGCGLNNTIAKTMFVGLPEIHSHLIDGVATQSKNVCPGWHLLSAQVRGDDTDPPCMTWQLVNNIGTPPHTLYDVNCNWATLYMSPQNNAPAFVRVTATNECGTIGSYFYLYPVLSNCKEEFLFSIYPNPASDVLNLEVLYDDGEHEQFSVTVSDVQLVNMMGATVLDLREVNSEAVELDLVGVANGLYVVRARVGDEWLTKAVQVSKE